MENSINDMYISLEAEGIFDKNKTLYLLDLPNESMLGKINVKAGEHELFVFARGYNDDLKVGSRFNLIFPKRNIEKYIECEVELKYISINPKYDIDYLPKGYSGICLLKFSNQIPIDLFKKIAGYDDKKDKLIHDTLILTQKRVLGNFNKK